MGAGVEGADGAEGCEGADGVGVAAGAGVDGWEGAAAVPPPPPPPDAALERFTRSAGRLPALLSSGASTSLEATSALAAVFDEPAVVASPSRGGLADAEGGAEGHHERRHEDRRPVHLQPLRLNLVLAPWFMQPRNTFLPRNRPLRTIVMRM